MCGRFVSASTPDELANYFGAALSEELEALAEGGFEANFNVAPTTDILAVRARDGQRELSVLRWGLVPFWAKDLKVGNRMINVRSETVEDKPAFRRAFASRRCLIPADGFYEWAKIPGRRTKQPYYIHRSDGEPMAFAGLWERWQPRLEGSDERDPDAPLVASCTILTCTPNREVSTVHDRMPVLIPTAFWDDWLAPDTDRSRLTPMLVAPPDGFLELRPVSTQVNSVANNGPELIERHQPDQGPQGR